MSTRLPDAGLLRDIQILAETIELSRFEALSNGVGLGRVKVLQGLASPKQEEKPQVKEQLKGDGPIQSFKAKLSLRKTAPLPLPPKTKSQATVRKSEAPQSPPRKHTPKAATRSQDRRKPQKEKVSSRRMRNPHKKPPGLVVLMRLGALHSIDLLVVLLTVLAIFLGIGLVADSAHFVSDPKMLVRWLPIRYFLESSTLELVGLLYAIFFAYLVFFRIFLGKTLGTFLYPSPKEKNRGKNVLKTNSLGE